jgi:hypothetical protein
MLSFWDFAGRGFRSRDSRVQENILKFSHLDNTSRQNKNQIVFGYLSMLVEMGIFQNMKVGFCLVGHTHDHIDQMYNHFSITLKRKMFGSLPSLIECIKKAYIPEHGFHILEETIDM